MKALLLAICLSPCIIASTQQTTKLRKMNVLFIGNSYTYFNDMPQICTGIAASMGDVFFSKQSTIGGYSLKQHTSDSSTLKLIREKHRNYSTGRLADWDYVVLQEHSRNPSLIQNEVEKNVYPFAAKLDSNIHTHNPTARIIYYMTWGRKNGDSVGCKTWSAVCSYQGMDSLLALRYKVMAQKSGSLLSPVGAVWRYIRQNYPSIELYNSDESHPSEAGSYAAATCFYTLLFKKDPTTIPYNYTLSKQTATQIREAVKEVLYKHIKEWEYGN